MNKALAEAGVRPSVGVVVESGEVREVHHFAVLLGFGATAVNPWLALATVSEVGRADAVKAAANYVGAVCKGLMKILSKMGISTLRSYRSARIFEAVGLGPKLVGEYFAGVASPVGGLELEDIERRLAEAGAADAAPVLPPGGQYRFRKDGEEHLWTPQRVADFRESVRAGDYARFHRYTDSIDNDAGVTLRSRFAFREGAAGRLFLSVAIARLVSLSFNYGCNRHLVFRDGAHHAAVEGRSLARYLLLAAGIMTASWALTKGVAAQMPGTLVTPIKAVVDLCLFFASYALQKAFVFRGPSGR